MIPFFKKYKAFGYGAIILGIVVWYLESIGFIRIPKNEPFETTFIFTFWWLAISFFLHYVHSIKRKVQVLLKLAILILVVFMTFGADHYFEAPDHPIIILLIVLFWLGVFYLFFPKFFLKYRLLILASYSSILGYLLYIRLDENYLEIYHRDALNLLLLPVPILFIIWLYEQWRWFETLKSEKAKGELELLKSQVNPHFFFNTLNNLYALTVKNSEKAPDVILKLSDMMRYTIYEGKKDRVLLSEEITYLKNYIALHEIRHRKNVEIHFEHTIQPDDQIAPLLYIILLENAFKHGVEKCIEGAYLHIQLRSDEKRIEFTIENNFETSEAPEDKGIGLENLKRRLNLIYPNKHTLVLKQKDTIYKAHLILNKK